MRIGPYEFRNNLALAPMAGVTDRPFRQLCRELGAGMAASEMVSADARLWHTRKSRLRMDHRGEPAPRIVQIAGADPATVAHAARRSVALGAQVIDINMGCPAKKVCRKLAGSALLRDETLVAAILEAAVEAVDVPVTLKMRTGWAPDSRNGVVIARIAEDAGIQALAVHGRTRQCGFAGSVEHDTTRRIKQCVNIPVLANGDIDSPEKAREILDYTGADGLMIGRAAQGRPWIFREIQHFLETGTYLAPLQVTEVRDMMLAHLRKLHEFYGAHLGVRVARKHIKWYCQNRPGAESFRHRVFRAETTREQLRITEDFFDCLAEGDPQAA